MKEIVSQNCIHGIPPGVPGHTTHRRRVTVRMNFLDLVSFQREGWDLQSHEFRKVRKQSKKNTGQMGTLRRAVIVKGLFLGRL